MINGNYKWVWVFSSRDIHLASSNFERIGEHVRELKATGVTTAYPINFPVYDWAISEGFFAVKKEDHQSPKFIVNFSSASLDHYHFEKGERIPSGKTTLDWDQSLFLQCEKVFCVISASSGLPAGVFDKAELLDRWIQKLGLEPRVIDLELF